MEKEKTFTFPEALALTVMGKQITRLEWNDRQVYGFIMNGVLYIRTEGQYKNWILSTGDIVATDWIVI